MYVKPPEWAKELARRHPRRMGVVAASVGAVLLLGFVVLPLFLAQHHVHRVIISFEVTVVAIATLAVGSLQILMGRGLTKLIEPTDGGSRMAALVMVLIIFQGAFMAHRALKEELTRRGYQPRGPKWQYEMYQYPAA